MNEFEVKSEDQNKCDVMSGERLFYNRVPKCGSTTLITLLRKLSKLNGFIHLNSKIYDKRMLDIKQQENLIKGFMQYTSPFSYDRHIYFIDFKAHNVLNPPIYINLIREPIERIISSYYYRRSVAFKAINDNSTQRIKPSNSWLRKSFENCVKSKDPECAYNYNNSFVMSLVPYFCGQSDKCLQMGDKWALEVAKHNIEKSYQVIGVLEHMNITLNVLQHKIPKFFAGVSELYFQSKQIHGNKNRNKVNVTNEVKQYLKTILVNEYKLYEFAVQRLFTQYYSIKNVI